MNTFYLHDKTIGLCIIDTLCPVVYDIISKRLCLVLARMTDILTKFECSVKYVGGKNSQRLNNRRQISIKWENPTQAQLKLLHLKTS